MPHALLGLHDCDPVGALQFPREQVEVKPGPVYPVLHGVVHVAPEVRLLQDHVSAVAGWLEGTPVQSVGGITSYTPVASAHKVSSSTASMCHTHTHTHTHIHTHAQHVTGWGFWVTRAISFTRSMQSLPGR